MSYSFPSGETVFGFEFKTDKRRPQDGPTSYQLIGKNIDEDPLVLFSINGGLSKDVFAFVFVSDHFFFSLLLLLLVLHLLVFLWLLSVLMLVFPFLFRCDKAPL